MYDILEWIIYIVRSQGKHAALVILVVGKDLRVKAGGKLRRGALTCIYLRPSKSLLTSECLLLSAGLFSSFPVLLL